MVKLCPKGAHAAELIAVSSGHYYPIRKRVILQLCALRKACTPMPFLWFDILSAVGDCGERSLGISALKVSRHTARLEVLRRSPPSAFRGIAFWDSEDSEWGLRTYNNTSSTLINLHSLPYLLLVYPLWAFWKHLRPWSSERPS